MTAEELLNDLVQRDVAVTVDGERLRIDAPRGVLTEELRRSLSEHKLEIVELIQRRPPAPDEDPAEQPVKVERIATMTLGEFAQAGLIARVRSNILGCEVLFVSDNVSEIALEGNDLPVYRAAEMRKLAILRPRPRALQCIHDVKTIFHGVITDVRERNDRNQGREVSERPARAALRPSFHR